MHDTQTHKTLLYYLLGYGIASILSFTIYAELKKDTGQASITGLQGLLYKNKIAGTSLLICLLSFTGIPPLAGFWGKFGILSGGLEGHLLPLVICAILASIIGAYNYVRIIFLIATPDQKNTQSIHLRPFFSSWILLGTVLLVVLGLIPDLFLSKI
jgi:NADH-quinone oxidoreductase subunit N